MQKRLPPLSQQSNHSRVRTGCVTCKQRKLKCDGGKPLCRRCLLRGTQCKYEATQAGTSKSNAKQRIVPTTSLAVVPLRGPPPRPPTDIHEQNIMSLFVERIGPANIPYECLGSWALTCFQLARNDPASKHLLLAFTTVHRAFWGLQSPGAEAFYYDQMNKAIACILDLSAFYRDDLILYHCGLFGLIEIIRTGSYEAVQRHLRSGFRILSEWESEQPSLPIYRQNSRRKIRGSMLPVLQSANRILSTLGSSPTSSIPLRGQFRTWNSAAKSLESIMIFWILPSLHKPDDWVHKHSVQRGAKLLSAWSKSFEEFDTNSPMPIEKHRAVEFLRAQYAQARILVAYFSTKDVPILDNSIQWFTRVIQLLKRLVVDLETTEDPTFRTDPGCHHGLGLIPLSFFVILACPVPAVKQMGLQLLQKLDITEGSWNSAIAVTIAEMTVFSGFQLPRKKEGQFTTALHGLCHIESANCEYNNAKRTAKISVTYQVAIDGEWKWYFAERAVDDAKEYDACRRTKWPLEAVVRSWGYYRVNQYPTPYYQACTCGHFDD